MCACGGGGGGRGWGGVVENNIKYAISYFLLRDCKSIMTYNR